MAARQDPEAIPLTQFRKENGLTLARCRELRKLDDFPRVFRVRGVQSVNRQEADRWAAHQRARAARYWQAPIWVSDADV